MTLDASAVLRLVEQLSLNNAIRANIKHSVRNGIIVGGCATAGSIVLGPVGVAIGAAVGTGVVYASGNNYVSLISAVRQLSGQERARLVEEMNTIVNSLSYDDVLVLQAMLSSGAALSGLSNIGRAALVAGIRTFFAANTAYTIEGA